MEKIKKIWPYLVALVVFVAVACIYMSPVLDGKVIAASDQIGYRGGVHEAQAYHEETGNYTWWTGSMFSGMPNYQIGGGHYVSQSLLQPIRTLLMWDFTSPLTMVLLYCLGFFALLRSFKVDKWLCIVGALAIAFSSYFFIIIGARHDTKTTTLAIMPAVIAGLYLIFNGHKKTGVCMTMICSAVGFYPHPQMSYYMCFILGFIWLAELWKTIISKAWKTFAICTTLFVGAFGIGLGTGVATTLVNLEYAQETMRGGHSDLVKENDVENKTQGLDLDYATAWSYGIDECWTFLIPNYMGGSSNYQVGTDSELYDIMVKQGVQRKQAEQFCQSLPTYWGDQPFTAGPVYMGAIVCFLFVLGLLIVKGPYKWAILAVTILSVMLSWGHNWMPLTKLFFSVVPMYNKFRAVSSILVIAEITMPLLGFLALKQLCEMKQQVLLASDGSQEKYFASPVIKNLVRQLGIAGGVIVVLLLGALFTTSGFVSPNDEAMFSQLPEWLSDGIVMQRQAMFTSDVYRSLGFVLCALVLLVVYLKLPKFKSTGLLALCLGALILLDMWPVDKRYMNDGMFSKGNSFDQAFKMQPWEKQILDNDKDPNFRVMNLAVSTFNDARTSYRLKSVGGYSAAKLRRYQDLIDEHLSKMHWPVIDMLNTKYIIFKNQQTGETEVQLNPNAMGNAWFVDTLIVVDTPNQECDGLMEYDLHTTAVLDKEYADNLKGYPEFAQIVNPKDSAATVTLAKYTPEYIEYDATSQQDGTIVFSEIYYPHGWKALIDGEPAEHFRVNYLLRALNVPAGQHHIRFEFRPESVEKGNMLSMIFVIAMYVIIAGCVISAFRKKNANC